MIIRTKIVIASKSNFLKYSLYPTNFINVKNCVDVFVAFSRKVNWVDFDETIEWFSLDSRIT